MNRFVKTSLVATLVVLLPFCVQIPGCVMAYSPKHGRVVDEQGHGVAGATVVAMAHFHAIGWIHGSANRYNYRVVAQTDAQGDYQLPNTWMYASFALPGMDANTTWTVIALKPGYIMKADEQSVQRADIETPSVSHNPSAVWLGAGVRVAPIEMRPVGTQSLADMITYYGHVLSLAPIGHAQGQDDLALRRDLSDLYLPQICALDPNTSVEWAGHAAVLSPNRTAFSTAIDAIEPGRLDRSPLNPHPGYYRADTVCKALSLGWHKQ